MKQIILFFLLFLISISSVFAGSFVYPLDQISKSTCRFSNWNTLDNGCKMPLPHILNADYAKYKNNTEYRRIYSVLWASTYDYGWDI